MVVLGIITSGTFAMFLALPVEIAPKEAVGAASRMLLSIGYIEGLVGPWLSTPCRTQPYSGVELCDDDVYQDVNHYEDHP